MEGKKLKDRPANQMISWPENYSFIELFGSVSIQEVICRRRRIRKSSSSEKPNPSSSVVNAPLNKAENRQYGTYKESEPILSTSHEWPFTDQNMRKKSPTETILKATKVYNLYLCAKGCDPASNLLVTTGVFDLLRVTIFGYPKTKSAKLRPTRLLINNRSNSVMFLSRSLRTH